MMFLASTPSPTHSRHPSPSSKSSPSSHHPSSLSHPELSSMPSVSILRLSQLHRSMSRHFRKFKSVRCSILIMLEAHRSYLPRVSVSCSARGQWGRVPSLPLIIRDKAVRCRRKSLPAASSLCKSLSRKALVSAVWCPRRNSSPSSDIHGRSLVKFSLARRQIGEQLF